MFVRIEMRWMDAGVGDLLNLRAQLIVWPDVATGKSADQLGNTGRIGAAADERFPTDQD